MAKECYVALAATVPPRGKNKVAKTRKTRRAFRAPRSDAFRCGNRSSLPEGILRPHRRRLGYGRHHRQGQAWPPDQLWTADECNTFAPRALSQTDIRRHG